MKKGLLILLCLPLIGCVQTDIPKKAKFNTLIKGSGSPTIVFESALGTPLSNWDKIQTKLF